VRDAGLFQQRPAAGGELDTAPVAAPTDRAARVQRDVAELAGGARGAAIEPAVQHDAGPDAGGHLEIDQVAAALAGAPHVLRQRGHVRVVVGAYRQLQAPGQVLARDQFRPAGQQRGRADPAGQGQRCRNPQTHPDHVGADRAELGQYLVEQSHCQLEHLLGVVVALPVQPRLPVGEHHVAQIGHRDPDVPAADVDPGGQPGPAGQPDHRGRPATGRAGRGQHLLGDQAGRAEVGQPGRDGRAGQPGKRDQLVAGTRAMRPEHVGDPAGAGVEPVGPPDARRLGADGHLAHPAALPDFCQLLS
jgi:hypothetical protein